MYETQKLDEKLSQESAQAFYGATSVPCSLIDADGRVLFSVGTGCADCTLCREIEKATGYFPACNEAQTYGLMQAERFGGKYIYFCPVGLTCFISPIMIEDVCVGSLSAGPLLMVEPEDFLTYDLMERHKIKPEFKSRFKRLVAKIPVATPEKINDYSTILFNQAAFIASTAQERKIYKNKKSNEIQGQIGHYLMSIKDDTDSIPPYPFKKERELHTSVLYCDKQNAQRLLNELLGHIFLYSGGEYEVIRSRVLEIIILISRAAIDGGADESDIFALNNRYAGEIYTFYNVDDLCFWLSTVLTRFIDYVFNIKDIKHLDIIHKALDYIRRHYSEKISLESTAEHVFLSASYFSKIFKEEMNCKFNTYLNKVRIDKSKDLLLSEKVKLIDVAGLVGFEDQSYFSKVFKKHTGVTPGYYREKRGNIREKTSE